MNEAISTGLSFPAACALPAAAWPLGLKSGKVSTLTSVTLPAPGAVTMLSRPVEKSTNPVATVTPDVSSPYGLKLANSAGTTPGEDDSWDWYTFTSLGTPGPDPTMMLSEFVPSI